MSAAGGGGGLDALRQPQPMTAARLAHLERVEKDAAEFVQWYDMFDAESREGYRGFVRDNAHRNATAALRRLRLSLGLAPRDDAKEPADA